MNVNKQKAANHENHQGQQLGDGEKVADPRSHPYAADVCSRETADQNGENHETRGWTLGLRPEPCQVINENAGNRGPGAYACQPQKPSRLEAQKTSESRFCVQVRSTGLLKARSNLGHTGGDYADSGSGDQVSDGALTTQDSGDG